MSSSLAVVVVTCAFILCSRGVSIDGCILLPVCCISEQFLVVSSHSFRCILKLVGSEQSGQSVVHVISVCTSSCVTVISARLSLFKLQLELVCLLLSLCFK